MKNNKEFEEMTDFEACMIAEEVGEHPFEKTVRAWSHLIKTGLCWKLQGWFGRCANSIIEGGSINEHGEINWAVVDEQVN